jgi:sugar-specific transcriptional regulator TrmB
VRAALESRKSQFDLAFSKEQKERENAVLELTRVLEPSVRRTVDGDDDAVFLRGINSIMSKFREVVSESKDIILVATKSMGAKELFKPYLEERGAKAVRVLLSKKFAPTKADLQFIAQSGLRVRRAENTFLDLMVADERVVMIGVPDPTIQEEYHSIAVVIASRPFARSVRESLEDIWDQANEISPAAR